MTGREIIDVLERLLMLAWFRYGALQGIEQNKYPPIVVWRYDTEAMEAEEIKLAENKIITAVESFQGNVNWILYFSGRNWVLLPERVKGLEESGEYRSDTEVLIMLAKEEPDFGLEANNDLPELAKLIEKHLSKS